VFATAQHSSAISAKQNERLGKPIFAMDENHSVPLASSAFDAYNQKLQTAGLNATRKAAGLPTDVTFHRSMDQEFAEGLDAFSERVLAVTNRLLALVSTVDQTQASRGKGKVKLEGQDDAVDHFHNLVVDSMDQLLEKTVRFVLGGRMWLISF
jgi:exosome complex exonuclease RRP6